MCYLKFCLRSANGMMKTPAKIHINFTNKKDSKERKVSDFHVEVFFYFLKIGTCLNFVREMKILSRAGPKKRITVNVHYISSRSSLTFHVITR